MRTLLCLPLGIYQAILLCYSPPEALQACLVLVHAYDASCYAQAHNASRPLIKTVCQPEE